MRQDYFLEAHYYSGGLRHRAYCLAGERPEWAPPADSVGFTDEFELERGAAAIEVRRMEHSGQRLTWLGVYHPSVDSKLGARSNHAGVGVWLHAMTLIDARSLIHGLDLLAGKLAQSVDPDALDLSARDFLSLEYVGAYVAPLDDYPSFGGLRFARGPLAETRLSYLRADGSPADCPALGDYVTGLLFGTIAARGSRELICVSAHEPPSAVRTTFDRISVQEDQLAKFIKALPNVMSAFVEGQKAAEQQAATLEAENATLKRQVAETSTLKERLRSFEQDPLHVVLDAINDLGQQVESLTSRLQTTRPSIPTANPFGGTRRSPVTGTQRRVEEPEAEDSAWIFLVLLVAVVVFTGVVILFLAKRYWP